MPVILELREIDGDLWCRIGNRGDFPNGVALTPDEQTRNRNKALEAAARLVDGHPGLAEAIREYKQV